MTRLRKIIGPVKPGGKMIVMWKCGISKYKKKSKSSTYKINIHLISDNIQMDTDLIQYKECSLKMKREKNTKYLSLIMRKKLEN